MNETKAIEIIKELDALFKFTYWIDQGTLLGAYRDGQIVIGDTDIDFSTYIENGPAFVSLLPKLKEMGYEIRLHDDEVFLLKDSIPVSLAFYRHEQSSYCIRKRPFIGGNWLLRVEQLYDFSMFHNYEAVSGKTSRIAYFLTQPKFIRGFWIWLALWIWKINNGKEMNMRIPEIFYDPQHLTKIKLYDLTFYAPAFIPTYLTFKYGYTCMTPQTNWSLVNDGGVKLSLPITFDFSKTFACDSK